MVNTADASATQAGSRPVCVVTTPGDLTADAVIVELHKLDTPVFRVDLADFPGSAELDARFDGARWTGTLAARGRSVRLEDLGAVMWWHPMPCRAGHGLAPAEAEWASREATAGLAGVLMALDCLHLNHPAATLAAQSKPYALAEAARCGLRVPATWIGNIPRAAIDFATTTGRGVVCKSLATPGLDLDGDPHPDPGSDLRYDPGRHHGTGHGADAGRRRRFFPTTPVDPATFDGSLALTAHQLQTRIDKHHEVRLTVVGNQMFAARIDAYSQAAKADFRADYHALTYRPIDVPVSVRRAVTAWLGRLGLRYAAIDLLIDHDGQWWAIDLNPAGQYGWIAHHLPDLTISAAIAALLTAPTTPGDGFASASRAARTPGADDPVTIHPHGMRRNPKP